MQRQSSKAPRGRSTSVGKGNRDSSQPTSGRAAPVTSSSSGQPAQGTSAGRRAAEGAHKTARPASAAADKEAPLTPAALIYLSEEHTNQLRQAFDMFDSAGTGRIKASEVKVAFYALGYPVNSRELEDVLRAAGVSTAPGPDGAEATMDFGDFYNVLLRKMTEKENRQESVRAFTQLDQDDKGYISLEDLREIADSLHMELTDDELAEMMLFAQSTTAGLPSGGDNGVSPGSGNAAVEFGAKESLAVTEDQFLKLLKRANVY